MASTPGSSWRRRPAPTTPISWQTTAPWPPAGPAHRALAPAVGESRHLDLLVNRAGAVAGREPGGLAAARLLRHGVPDVVRPVLGCTQPDQRLGAVVCPQHADVRH